MKKGFARIMTMKEVLENGGNLKVSKYICSSKIPNKETSTLEELYKEFNESSSKLKFSMNDLFKTLR